MRALTALYRVFANAPSDDVTTRSRQNRTIIRFCLLFVLYITCLYVLIHIVQSRTQLLNDFSSKVAWLTARIIELFGANTQTFDSAVFSQTGFAIEISYKCTGIMLGAFYLAGVLAYPCSKLKKLWGSILGITLIFCFNLARIVGLFYIGIHANSAFDLFHAVIGEFFMIAVTLLVWLLWLRWIKPSEARRVRLSDKSGQGYPGRLHQVE
jgi:exosortase H (IPTLxxWG-CTERM-specific)